jgi:LytS/YehU family sensor histidine kinase
MLFNSAGGNRFIITRHDWDSPVIQEIAFSQSAPSSISIKDEYKGKRKVYLQKGYEYAVLSYGINPLFRLRYLVFTGLYLGLLLFIQLIMSIQKIRLQKQNELRSKMLELQLKSINNQLDPHFTFNAFNSIAAIIREGESEEAYSSFTKFTGLIRSNLLDSNKISRTIEEEIQFVTRFLELQKLRFKDQLNYEIQISEEVDMAMKIPKMIMQSYVENSIKHGLRQKQGPGLLQLSLATKEKILVITIEDNGIGREAAKAYSAGSTGMGLHLMEQFYELFREYYKVRISHEIVDLYDENGNPAGTRVVIRIPQLSI